MNTSDLKCRKCGKTFPEAVERGIYFKRVNEKGCEPINECRPSCEHFGGQDDALLAAIEDQPDEI